MKFYAKIYYEIGEENEVYWKMYDSIKKSGKGIGFRWDGDYSVQTYEINDKIYEIWINEELGIHHMINEFSKENA